jgi:glucose/arabinose dehydrogenase
MRRILPLGATIAVASTILLFSPGAPPGAAQAADGDQDGVADAAETNCGSDPANPNLRPERTDDQFAGRDDDGDQAIDEALPSTAPGHDCDGDGFTGSAEANVFFPATTRDQDACGLSAWPLDFVSGGIPVSTNRVTLTDVTSFVAPVRRMNTNPGDTGFDRRWDLVPGPGIFSKTININDITATVIGSTSTPQMLGGVRAINGPSCPWPVVAGGYQTISLPNTDVDSAVALVPIPGSPGEAIMLSQFSAQLWRVSLTGQFAPALYGDIASLVGGNGWEEGLLAFAFAPGFPADDRVYVYYTQGTPQPSILSRFEATATDLNEASAEPILSVPQPHPNHNGGELAFGPDGFLYLSLGDGGGQGDPGETGQNKDDLLGSVLRIDVSGPTGYAVPAGNPFVGVDGVDELWAYGFRNPWRFSFDSYTGDLWLGDVGEASAEEINLVSGGGNYGWDNTEGFSCFEPSNGCDETGISDPEFVYDHSQGCAITGGYIYRGMALAELGGWYIYSDYCSGRIWAYDAYGNGANILLVDTPYNITSFAQTPDGEVLVVTQADGVFRLKRN